jgi:hypothetical protein
MHVRIKNTSMIREMSSQAVLSTSKVELSNYRNQRELKLREKKLQETRLHTLEEEVAALKALVKELIDDKSNKSS